MSGVQRSLGFLGAVAALVSCGCVASKSQVTALQSQNRTLNEQARAQLAEIENLKIHSRNVEDRLIRAEEDLARAEQSGRQSARGAMPPGLNARLADLAQRFPVLQYDPATGISKFDTDLLFDSGDDKLRPGADRILAEFAQVFQSPEARELKIMVVGHADSQGIKGRELRERYPSNWHLSAGRALVVAEHLRRAGIPESRMGVTGFGQFQPIASNDTADTRQRNRRVEILVLGPETPVVGWADNPTSVLREAPVSNKCMQSPVYGAPWAPPRFPSHAVGLPATPTRRMGIGRSRGWAKRLRFVNSNAPPQESRASNDTFRHSQWPVACHHRVGLCRMRRNGPRRKLHGAQTAPGRVRAGCRAGRRAARRTQGSDAGCHRSA
jgi:chemotaxis protein MotB